VHLVNVWFCASGRRNALRPVTGIGSGEASVERCIELARRPQVQRAWCKCRHLIIDEISMVDGLFFEVRSVVYFCLLAR
jgi:hypothetical protein